MLSTIYLLQRKEKDERRALEIPFPMKRPESLLISAAFVAKTKET